MSSLSPLFSSSAFSSIIFIGVLLTYLRREFHGLTFEARGLNENPGVLPTSAFFLGDRAKDFSLDIKLLSEPKEYKEGAFFPKILQLKLI